MARKTDAKKPVGSKGSKKGSSPAAASRKGASTAKGGSAKKPLTKAGAAVKAGATKKAVKTSNAPVKDTVKGSSKTGEKKKSTSSTAKKSVRKTVPKSAAKPAASKSRTTAGNRSGSRKATASKADTTKLNGSSGNGRATTRAEATGRTISKKVAGNGSKGNGTAGVKNPAPAGAKGDPKAAGAKVEKATAAADTTAPVIAPPEPARPALPAAKPLKEKVQIEFNVRSTPTMLYELISTPSGFAEWYCDDVNVKGDEYTFIWQGEEEATTMIGRRLGEVIRFHRHDDEDENAYFEFRVRIDDMTNDVALIVTDHAWPHEVDETRNLWSSQIANLLRVLGA